MTDPLHLFRALHGSTTFCMILAFLMLSTAPLKAQREEEALRGACTAQVAARFSQWRFAPIREDVAEWAKSENMNPAIAYGDFDGDGRKDVALLIQAGPSPDSEYPGRLDSLHIAVCMNPTAGMKLYVVEKLYCGDGITVSPQGKHYFDLVADTEGFYKLDGVRAYCFEKAGATYVFEKGAFRQIVDGD